MISRVSLEKLTESNYKLLRKWRNENRKYFKNSQYVNVKQHENWFRGYLFDIHDYSFVVYYDNVPVGVVGLNLQSGTASIERVMLGDKSKGGKGIITTALIYLMASFGFTEYYLCVLKNNEKATKLYKNLGFKFWYEEKGYVYMKIDMAKERKRHNELLGINGMIE